MNRSLPAPGALVATLALVAVLAATTTALARPATAEPSTFAQLDALEARLAHHHAEDAALRRDVGDALRRLGAVSTDTDTARRATAGVRRDVHGRLAAWERALRATEREGRHWPVGADADTRSLLLHARGHALEDLGRDLALLRTVDADTHLTDLLLVRSGRLNVELAQNAARGKTVEHERERLLDDAGKPARRDRARNELARTRADLDESLEGALRHQTDADFHRLKGTLLPPVSAPIAHGYGPRKQGETASYVRHTGYTYTVEVGTPVRTVASGLVVFARRFEGYGNLVIVDHGSGYHSLYAHLDTIDVELGSHVARQHTLGKSGESGSLEGPRLYFELRHDGQPIDPGEWFVRR